MNHISLVSSGSNTGPQIQGGFLQMEQIRNLDQLLEYAKEVGPKKISVACAEDTEVMEAVENARKAGIANAFLVGNADKIKEVADKLGVDLANYEVIDEKGGEAASALKAVELVSSGQAQIVMKGMVATANFLRGVLNKEKGLRSGKTLSHVYIHQVKGYDRVFFISDPAFNMYPELKVKIDIVKTSSSSPTPSASPARRSPPSPRSKLSTPTCRRPLTRRSLRR